jgi:hypothetical protein
MKTKRATKRITCRRTVEEKNHGDGKDMEQAETNVYK